MLDGYDVLAPVYDKLNGCVDHVKWTDFIENCIRRYSKISPVKSILDMGCGTGAMTVELSRRGYDMTGLDISENMLSVADRNARETGEDNILFVCEDMSSFELYGTVDAIICVLDGINHLTVRDDLNACFACVSRYLNQGGLFMFDLNTPYKFRTVYADKDYVLEDDAVMCCWRNRLSKNKDIVDFYLTVFEKNGKTWVRSNGVERERAYGLRSVKNALASNGMELVNVSSGFGFDEIADNTERWFITARKK